MAWRSSGTSNSELVDNLKRFGVIHSRAVEEGFRNVDRRFFVPPNRQEAAHSDQPLKEGHIHISAPHIYGTVLEALELTPQSSMSFLNGGSGTGYLSCIVAEILGPTSQSVGIELCPQVVEHSQQAMARWRAARPASAPELPPLPVLQGNVLEIDATQGECLVGFDRIYVGAALDKSHLARIAALLKPGGIMVGPVEDELVKVIRIGHRGVPTSQAPPSPPRSSRGHPPPLSDEFTQQVLSGVRFSTLLQHPSTPVVVPSRVWSPENHKHYPESFRRASKTLLLCSRTATVQPPPPVQQMQVNVAPMLPPAVWQEILSFTHRNWFDKDSPDEDFLRRRLVQEQLTTQRAQEARLEAEARLHMMERERDVYRLLALRWQSRLQTLMNERREGNSSGGDAGDDDEDDIAGADDIEEAVNLFADEPLVLRLGSLRAMMRLDNNSDADEQDDSDDNEDAEVDEDHDDSDMEAEELEEATEVDHEDPDSMMVSPSSHSQPDSMSIRQQVRSISISSEL